MALTNTAPIILVKNVADSITYWRDKVGFEAKTYPGHSRFALLMRDACRIMLIEVGQNDSFTPNWRIVEKTSDVYIWVDDAAGLYQELTNSGANIDFTLYDTPWGTREFGIQDIDDHDITFGQVL